VQSSRSVVRVCVCVNEMTFDLDICRMPHLKLVYVKFVWVKVQRYKSKNVSYLDKSESEIRTIRQSG